MTNEQKAAVERLKAACDRPFMPIKTDDIELALSLITSLEEDKKRLGAFKAAIADMQAPEIKSFTKREYWKAGARAMIEKFNAAMKGAV